MDDIKQGKENANRDEENSTKHKEVDILEETGAGEEYFIPSSLPDKTESPLLKLSSIQREESESEDNTQMTSYLLSYPRKQALCDEISTFSWSNEGEVIPESPDIMTDLGPERSIIPDDSNLFLNSSTGLMEKSPCTPPSNLRSVNKTDFEEFSAQPFKRMKLDISYEAKIEDSGLSEDIFGQCRSVILDETADTQPFVGDETPPHDSAKESIPESPEEGLTEEYNPDIYSTPKPNPYEADTVELNVMSQNSMIPVFGQVDTELLEAKDIEDTKLACSEMLQESYISSEEKYNSLSSINDKTSSEWMNASLEFQNVNFCDEDKTDEQKTVPVLAEIQNLSPNKISSRELDVGIKNQEEEEVGQKMDAVQTENVQEDFMDKDELKIQEKFKETSEATKEKENRRSSDVKTLKTSPKKTADFNIVQEEILTEKSMNEDTNKKSDETADTSASTVELNNSVNNSKDKKEMVSDEGFTSWCSHTYPDEIQSNSIDKSISWELHDETDKDKSVFKVPSSADFKQTTFYTANKEVETVRKLAVVEIEVTIDNLNKVIKKKEIVDVQIISPRKLAAEMTSTSCVEHGSTSSGSVYSDSAGLPFRLRARLSTLLSTSTSSNGSPPVSTSTCTTPLRKGIIGRRSVKPQGSTQENNEWNRDEALQKALDETINKLLRVYQECSEEKSPVVKAVDTVKEEDCKTEEQKEPEPVILKRVLARWNDKNYYLGSVVNRDEATGRNEVKFDDGGSKHVHDDFIIDLELLQPGCLVVACVDQEKQIYKCGNLVVCPSRECSNQEYQVEIESGDNIVSVNSSQIYLTRDLVSCLIPGRVCEPAISDITLDNIVKRRARSCRADSCSPKPPTPVGKRSKSTPAAKTTEQTTKQEDELIAGFDPDLVVSTGRGIITSPTIKRSSKSKSKGLSMCGSLPPEGCDIFSGYTFLLTCVQSTSSGRKVVKSDSESEFSESEDRDFYNTNYSYNVQHLINQLTRGGGVVCEELEQVDKDQYDRCRLVTNKPCNTIKYLTCVSLGIHVMLHVQVIQICDGISGGQKMRHLKPILSGSNKHHIGWSIEENKWKLTPKNMKTIFENLRIFVLSDERGCLKAILKNTGAVVVSEGEINQVDVVVSDKIFPPSLVETLSGFGENAPALLSTYWLRESLMQGQARPYKAHPLYDYRYQNLSEPLPSTSNL